MGYEGNRYEVEGRDMSGAIRDGCTQHCVGLQPGKPDCVRLCAARVSSVCPHPIGVTCN